MATDDHRRLNHTAEGDDRGPTFRSCAMNIDIAKRVYDHSWKLDPIVRSLLDTPSFEARPQLVIGPQGRPWVAWEEGDLPGFRAGAHEEAPRRLRLNREIIACGHAPQLEVMPGTATTIATVTAYFNGTAAPASRSFSVGAASTGGRNDAAVMDEIAAVTREWLDGMSWSS